jgi:hypothetical protein
LKANLSIGLALLALTIATMATALAQQPSPATVQPGTDVDKLFANLYPVFSHPRCLNCHGVVVEPPGDPASVTKESHPAAENDDPEKGAECGSCHDAEEVAMLWGLAPPHLRWVGLDVDAVCAIQATEAKARNTRAGGSSPGKQGSYLHHIDHDPLIRQAWDGRAGGALPIDEKKATPPGSHATFLAAATEWVNAGMPCRTNALVTQRETFSSSYSFAGPGPESRTSVSQTAARQVVVRRLRDGRVEADVDMSGSETFETVTRLMGATGPCTNTVTTTNDWSRSSPRRVNARLTVTMTGKAGYRVAVTLPEVKTTLRSVQKIEGDCGVPLFSSADTTESEWPEWTIDIECPSTVPDGDVLCIPDEPQSFSAADGLIRRREATITADTTWLRESPAATNRADTGAPLLIDSQTSWFFVMSAK